MKPLISVLVPVYNVEKYLSRCLDSLVGQTYENLEIILLDDGSKDKCGAICDAYGEKDSRIRVIHIENKGLSAGRNRLLSEARGEYLMFVDSDDYISLDAVQVLYDRLMADGSDMAIGKYVYLFDDGSIDDFNCRWMQDSLLSGWDVIMKMQNVDSQRLDVGTWAKLYKRELFTGIVFPALKYGEDLAIFPVIMERCDRVSIVDHLVYYYYQRADSIVHEVSEPIARDAVEANLYMAKYLFSHALFDGAGRWFEKAVKMTWRLRNRTEAAQQIAKYFSKEEQKRLPVKWNLKTRILYVSIYSQLFYDALRTANRVTKALKRKR